MRIFCSRPFYMFEYVCFRLIRQKQKKFKDLPKQFQGPTIPGVLVLCTLAYCCISPGDLLLPVGLKCIRKSQ